MKTTMTVKKWIGDRDHNMRLRKVPHADPTRKKDSIILIDCPDLQAKYDELFGEATAEYNAKQTRNDRKKRSHYDEIMNPETKDGKVKKDKTKRKPFYELLIELGNKDNDLNDKKINELAPQIFKEFVDEVQQKYGKNIEVIGAYIHMDEATPHLHLDYIPIGTTYKIGLKKQNSHQKAMNEMGYFEKGERLENNKNKIKRDYHYWHDDLYKDLESISLKYGIERDNLHSVNKGVDIHEYKYQMDRAKELEKTNDEIQKSIDEKEDKSKRLDETIFKQEENKNQNLNILKAQNKQIDSNLNKDYKEKYYDLVNKLDEYNAYVEQQIDETKTNIFKSFGEYVQKNLLPSFTNLKNKIADKFNSLFSKEIDETKTYDNDKDIWW